MRQKRTDQVSIFDLLSHHEIGREELLAESVLQQTISRIRPETWKRINRCLLAGAQAVQLERDLSRVTQNTLGYLEHAERALTLVQPAGQGCLASPGNAL